jgi:hypothetical protein
MPKNSIRRQAPSTANILAPEMPNTYMPKQEEKIKAAPIPKPPTKGMPLACNILYFKETFASKNIQSILEIKAPDKIIKYLSIFAPKK